MFLVRGVALAQRRLLWRVRRKLIISYIFIGFIPAILIVAFFLLGGAAAVLELQLVPRPERGCARLPIAPNRSPRRRRSRFSAPAAATSKASSRSARWRRRASSQGASIAIVEMRRACSELPAPRRGTTDQRPPAAPPLVVAGSWAHVDAAGRACPTGSAATASRGCWPCRSNGRRARPHRRPPRRRASRSTARRSRSTINRRRATAHSRGGVSRVRDAEVRGDRRSAGDRPGPAAVPRRHRRRDDERGRRAGGGRGASGR